MAIRFTDSYYFGGLSDKQIIDTPLFTTSSLGQCFETVDHPLIYISPLAVQLCIPNEFF